ncbi:uncharacterized protein SOCE26_013470 [Sorangium cellulosum]|uniref:Secreted protein n=1 Tax=Sorangium cellulosum TaxID=56 RepID=A0A2L0EKZ6_SORCE|nr:hypothetical protein [Sorangium cellulosum]AUX39952.1 uncharacterized protein SOCE26_013470 [Sorangium cellulosum]
MARSQTVYLERNKSITLSLALLLSAGVMEASALAQEAPGSPAPPAEVIPPPAVSDECKSALDSFRDTESDFESATDESQVHSNFKAARRAASDVFKNCNPALFPAPPDKDDDNANPLSKNYKNAKDILGDDARMHAKLLRLHTDSICAANSLIIKEPEEAKLKEQLNQAQTSEVSLKKEIRTIASLERWPISEDREAKLLIACEEDKHGNEEWCGELERVVNTGQQCAAWARTTAKKRIATNHSICKFDDVGRVNLVCISVGIIPASVSYVYYAAMPKGYSGQYSRQLASIGLPTASFRINPHPWFAIDIGGQLPAVLSFTADSNKTTSCTSDRNTFTDKLPCETRAELRPLVGIYTGVTFGVDRIGFLTLSPLSAGLARVGKQEKYTFYMGSFAGVLQLSNTF